MRLLMLGLNHRTADVALRERAGFSTDALPGALRTLRTQYPDCEAVILSTCNRTELYLARPSHGPPDVDALRAWWTTHRGLPADALTAATIHREQEPMIRHLFRVTAGLDSMVVGEPEVLGQVRRAYDTACSTQSVGSVLHKVFQQAISTARQTRHDTGLSGADTSVGSVALQFARTVFDNFSDKTVVTLGAGEIAKATLRRFVRQGPGRLWIVNRTPQRAVEIATALGIDPPQRVVRPWDDLPAALVEADVLICATGATQPVVGVDTLKPLLRKRRNRPLLVLDLGLPRDVEPGVGALGNVYLYNVDDLKDVVDHDPDRLEAIRRCEGAVNDNAAACLGEIQHRDLGRLIKQLRAKLNTLADTEHTRTQRKLQNAMDPQHHDAVEQLLAEYRHRLINKVLHLPLSQLDGKDPEAPLGFYAAALRRLFDLDDTQSGDDRESDAPHDPAHQAPPHPAAVHSRP